MKRIDNLLLPLLAFFIILRLYPIWGNNFPFAYDNAKDSLALLQMFIFKKPMLLGAVTSLDGLWQGPFWYYILFPLNLLYLQKISFLFVFSSFIILQ